MARILVVDDEDGVREAIRRRLAREAYQVSVAASAAEAAEAMRADTPFDVVVTDMSMEQADSGLSVLTEAVANDIFTEVIVLTAYGNVQNAVESMRRGAFDYLEKNAPGVDAYEMLVLKVGQAMERRRSSMRTVRRLDNLARTVGGS